MQSGKFNTRAVTYWTSLRVIGIQRGIGYMDNLFIESELIWRTATWRLTFLISNQYFSAMAGENAWFGGRRLQFLGETGSQNFRGAQERERKYRGLWRIPG